MELDDLSWTARGGLDQELCPERFLNATRNL
jgi:hypothetical protein